MNKLKKNILFLYRFLENRKYLTKLQEVLIRLIPLNREKEKIQNITKLYLTELINYGYSAGYLYHITNGFFYNYSVAFSDVTPERFFNIFNFDKKTFSAIYIVNKVFEEFKSLSTELNIKILNVYDSTPFNGEAKLYLDKKAKGNIFIVFDDINAVDDNMAMIYSEGILSKISNLFSFYHHKDKPYINKQVLIVNHTDNNSSLKEKNIKSIIKKSDISPKIAASKAKELFSNLTLERDAIYKISRAVDLHSIALGTEQIENKLLNLWTAIETLIPKDISSGEDRIIQIINAITPFQTVKYVNKIIEQLGNDFWYYDKRNSKRILQSVIVNGTVSRFHTLAALIMTVENQAVRDSISATLDTYPLLRFRLFTLNKQLSKGKGISKLVENHKQKVEWQIRRIYRVRNLIAHSGKMPSYTNILVENLHNYFDDMLNYVIDNAISEKRIKTIEEGVLNAEIEYQILMKNIESIGDADITINNYQTLI